MGRFGIIPKNTNPNFWNENENHELNRYNCGSLAFNVTIWYSPEWILFEECVCDYVEQMAERLWDDGCTLKEIADIYAEYYLLAILEDFKNEVKIYSALEPVKKDEELIAFRVGTGDLNEDDYYNPDIDFHFKVFRDGKWIEKNGSGDVHDCEEEKWSYDSALDYPYEYNSRTIYLIHKMNKI